MEKFPTGAPFVKPAVSFRALLHNSAIRLPEAAPQSNVPAGAWQASYEFAGHGRLTIPAPRETFDRRFVCADDDSVTGSGRGTKVGEAPIDSTANTAQRAVLFQRVG